MERVKLKLYQFNLYLYPVIHCSWANRSLEHDKSVIMKPHERLKSGVVEF